MSKNTKKKKSTTHHHRGDFDASKAVKPADVITDPRFEAAQRDPRFLTMRRVSRKVKIDSRFKKSSTTKISESAAAAKRWREKVDKFGRRSMGARKRKGDIERRVGVVLRFRRGRGRGRRGKKTCETGTWTVATRDDADISETGACRGSDARVGLEDSSSDDDEDDSDSSTSDTSDDEFKESSDSEELSRRAC